MRRSYALVVGLLLLPSCAAQRDITRLEAQLGDVQAELARRSSGDPGPSAAELAELELRLSKLESWSTQSETHAIGLADTLEKLRVDVQRMRQAAGDVGHGAFKKGSLAPAGLGDLEIRQYASAQGDPHFGRFGLGEAFAGAPELADRRGGKLVATFETTLGRFDCVLHEDQAPNTVANFVGLARGQRASLDPETGSWQRRRLYDGTSFHRVIAGFMIQGGDPVGTGKGGPGYVIADEVDPSLGHGVGTLSMANRGKNTGSSQFFVTVAKTAQLDGRHTVFGQCAARVPQKISKVAVDPRANHRPIKDVRLRRVSISRKPR